MPIKKDTTVWDRETGYKYKLCEDTDGESEVSCREFLLSRQLNEDGDYENVEYLSSAVIVLDASTLTEIPVINSGAAETRIARLLCQEEQFQNDIKHSYDRLEALRKTIGVSEHYITESRGILFSKSLVPALELLDKLLSGRFQWVLTPEGTVKSLDSCTCKTHCRLFLKLDLPAKEITVLLSDVSSTYRALTAFETEQEAVSARLSLLSRRIDEGVKYLGRADLSDLVAAGGEFKTKALEFLKTKVEYKLNQTVEQSKEYADRKTVLTRAAEGLDALNTEDLKKIIAVVV